MSGSILFEPFALSWLATRAVVQMKASGYREYESVVRRHLIPAFGGVSLEEVSTEVVQGWIARQKERGLAARTIVNHVQVLRQILEYAVICARIAENPVLNVVLPPQERTEMRYLTAEQLHELIEATSPSWRPLVAMAALVGIRKSEQLALRFSDIDVERRTISITKAMRDGVVTSTKTKASFAQIPLPESLILLIDHRRRQVANQNGLIFCRRDGSPLSDGTPNRVLAKALSTAGLPQIRWHDLRHSWVVAHLQAGTDIKTIQTLGRWSSVTTLLETYAHVIPTRGADAADRLDRMISQQD